MEKSTSTIYAMNILIIDNSESNTTLLEAILHKEGFTNTTRAPNVAQALEKLEDDSVDLVLLSYILPNSSGLQMSRLITQNMRHENTPVIMITANTDMQTLKSSFEHGASDYIAKPINAVELIARVHSHLIRKQVNDERKNSAITDALTNLYNRRYFDLLFDRQYEKASIEHKPCSFFMIDIDNFKKYNDNYGHQSGDKALQEVARTIQHQLNRESDYLFRLGGEEFAILLFNATEEYIQKLSEKIHLALQSAEIPHLHNEDYGYVTVSIGISTANDPKQRSKFDIYDSADKALYKAKESGRNRSVMVTL